VVGTVALFLPACSEGLLTNLGHYRAVDWLSIFYLGFFGTVAGFVWYYDGIQKIGPTKAGLFINFVPVSAVILAFFVLREPMTTSLLLGTLLVVTGVFLTNRSRPAAPSRSAGSDLPDHAIADLLRKQG